MEKITISNQNEIWPARIKLYKNIFGEAPWEEWFLCQNCGKNLPLSFCGQCQCGEIDNFKAFYDNAELKTALIEISLKRRYSELIAKTINWDIWFIWGWNSSLWELNKDKLWLNESQLAQLNDWIISEFLDFDFYDFYYLAEIGVKKDLRGQNIASQLYQKNLDKLKEKWEQFMLVRTTRKTAQPFQWFKKEWFREAFNYNDEQDRVILVYKI